MELFYSSPVEIQTDIHAARLEVAVKRTQTLRVLIESLRLLEITVKNKTRYRDYVFSPVDNFKHAGVTEVPRVFRLPRECAHAA
jgi:circadian clock protein KaiC